MIIGNFTYDKERDIYSGTITTLAFERAAMLCPTPKAGESAPDYRVVQGMDGGSVEFGAAWKRTSERGQDFLSVVLDDPTFHGNINAAMFRVENKARLVWSRAKARAAEPEPAAAKSPKTDARRRQRAAPPSP